MLARTALLLKRIAQIAAISALTFLAVRAFDAHRSAPLSPWHTFTPDEMVAEELDQADWADYLAREQTLFEQVRTEVTEKLEPEDRILSNRYFEKVLYIPAASRRTGIAPISSSPRASLSGPSSCSTG
jgi:hypothetical protein